MFKTDIRYLSYKKLYVYITLSLFNSSYTFN